MFKIQPAVPLTSPEIEQLVEELDLSRIQVETHQLEGEGHRPAAKASFEVELRPFGTLRGCRLEGEHFLTFTGQVSGQTFALPKATADRLWERIESGRTVFEQRAKAFLTEELPKPEFLSTVEVVREISVGGARTLAAVLVVDQIGEMTLAIARSQDGGYRYRFSGDSNLGIIKVQGSGELSSLFERLERKLSRGSNKND